MKMVLEATSKEGDIVMDFFLGIGTATAVAHKLKRKWIGIEKEGDILLFYRSRDIRGITSIGVVEKVYDNLTNPNEIISCVGKRSVYSRLEIEEIAKKPTKIILFWWIMHFEEPVEYRFLLDNGILNWPPRTIIKIPHDKYLKIKGVAEIDERYTIN